VQRAQGHPSGSDLALHGLRIRITVLCTARPAPDSALPDPPFLQDRIVTAKSTVNLLTSPNANGYFLSNTSESPTRHAAPSRLVS
jgi:hypothetical protein